MTDPNAPARQGAPGATLEAAPAMGCGLDAVPAIRKLFRLQWEEVQQKYVLLYPEGMVQLNQSAGEILKRCDGLRSTAAITADLEQAFQHTGLEADVRSFLEIAHGQGWIEYR
jgi:pyrroloquinoline quinone biosynthesis protein D